MDLICNYEIIIAGVANSVQLNPERNQNIICFWETKQTNTRFLAATTVQINIHVRLWITEGNRTNT